MRLFSSDDLKVNEMLLTGEPEDVAKFARMKKGTKSGKQSNSKNTSGGGTGGTGGTFTKTSGSAKADASGKSKDTEKEKSGGGGHDEGEKLTPENMAFSSCTVTNGKALAIVVATGMSTRVGRIAALLAAQEGGPKADDGDDEAETELCEIFFTPRSFRSFTCLLCTTDPPSLFQATPKLKSTGPSFPAGKRRRLARMQRRAPPCRAVMTVAAARGRVAAAPASRTRRPGRRRQYPELMFLCLFVCHFARLCPDASLYIPVCVFLCE